jgi:hypothetical protein
MLIDTQRQRSLIAALHLEKVFDLVHLSGHNPCVTHGDPEMHQSKIGGAVHSHPLMMLLQSLGIGADAAAASIRRNDADTARAATNIAGWMAYLPEDCVKAMVNDGWHWST